MPATRTRTSASVGSRMQGSGTSECSSRSTAWNVIAFTIRSDGTGARTGRT